MKSLIFYKEVRNALFNVFKTWTQSNSQKNGRKNQKWKERFFYAATNNNIGTTHGRPALQVFFAANFG